jgi:hypothetical protein
MTSRFQEAAEFEQKVLSDAVLRHFRAVVGEN